MSKLSSASRSAGAVLLLVGCAGRDVGDDLGQAGQAIIGGTADFRDTAVLAIELTTPTEQALCSGSLLAPNLVLTARHCVAPVPRTQVVCGQSMFGEPYAAADLWVSNAALAARGQFYPVQEISVPSMDMDLCGSDLALLTLTHQFSTAITPLAPRLDEPAKAGETFTAVGFGDDQSEAGAGIRRSLGGLAVECTGGDCREPDMVAGGEFVGEQSVCDGDSGGPSLDDDGRVIGVASRATQGCTLSVYAGLYVWRVWIREIAAAALDTGSYEQPSWELAPTTAANVSAQSAGLASAPARMSGCALTAANPPAAGLVGTLLPFGLLAAIRRFGRRRSHA